LEFADQADRGHSTLRVFFDLHTPFASMESVGVEGESICCANAIHLVGEAHGTRKWLTCAELVAREIADLSEILIYQQNERNRRSGSPRRRNADRRREMRIRCIFSGEIRDI
jgi:hypothetical protein